MSKEREALKLALEALKTMMQEFREYDLPYGSRAYVLAKDACLFAEKTLAQPEQEPVAITERMAFAFHNAITDGAIGTDDLMDIMRGLEAAFAHITTPPQRKPLTDEQVEKIIKANMMLTMNFSGIRNDLEEAAHGIKGDA